MVGNQLLKDIYAWLDSNYPEGLAWDKVGFHCFRDCDPIIRSNMAMETVEAEISNGGWGQLLWNTFPNWRELLTYAKEGYAMIDAGSQATAIELLRDKLSAFEAECAAAFDRIESKDIDYEFSQFTASGYGDDSFLEFMDETLWDKRERWLHQHEPAVRRAIAV